jgi:hypothetical protein
MNIGSHLVNSFDSGLQGKVRMEQGKETGDTSAVRSSSDISGLKEGAVFKGEILDIAGDKVTISLENQGKLQARLQADVELGVGDRLLFSVKENNSSQILIKPMFDSLYSAQTQTLEKVLDAAGLSPTEKNFSAAKELMDAGMPVDKGSIVKVLSQSMKFEGTSMQTLVSLNKMNIPVTQENIAQYERYLNYNHQLLGDISETADSIADFAKLLPENVSGDTLLSAVGDVLDIFSEDVVSGTEFLEEMQTEAGQIENGTLEIQTTGVEGNVAEQDVSGQNVQEQNGLEQNVPEQKLTEQNTLEQGSLEKSVLNKNSVDNEAADQAVKTDLPMESKEANTAAQSENRLMDSGLEKKFGVDKEFLTNLEHQLQNAGFSNEETKNIFENAKSPADLLKQITQGLQENGADTGAVHTVIASDEFKRMLSDVVKNSWTMNPKFMKDPKEIDELYDKITKQSKAFEEAIASKGGDTQQFNQNSQNMRQNMNFMEQLNNQMIYAQLPLKLSNQNVNSELYVYADKRKLLEKKDGISVMLHLDMDHLGMTDIKVTLTGSNVNARFYLNDQQSVDIVADNMEELADQLRERGFTLTNEVVKRQPQASINQVVDEIIDENAEKSIKRYTFDVKM